MTDSRCGSSQSSKRRRWDVKTKEVLKNQSDEKTKNKNGVEKLSKHSDILPENVNESEADTLGDKLSKLLNEVSEKQDESSYSSNDSCKIKRIPSAPPLENKFKEGMKKIKKNNKSVSPELITSQINKELAEMRTEITSNKMTKSQDLGVNSLMLNKASSSTFNGNISTIYCEKLNNFIVSTDNQFIQPIGDESFKSTYEINTRASFAIFIQTGFRTFSILCQGLLAGMVLTECLMLLVMKNDIFINNSDFSHSIHSMIYFLLTIGLLSSFDRSDIYGQDTCSTTGIKIPWTALFYLASFIITVIMMQVDDFIVNYGSFSEKIKIMKSETIHWWKLMALVRGFLIILGWTSIVRDPHTDALRNRITALI